MKITLPELGEGINNVEITDILVEKDTQIQKDDVLITVESDKASMEIPAELSGTITKVLINKGDSINPGDSLFEIKTESNSEAKTNELPEPIVIENEIKTDIEADTEPPIVEKENVQKETLNITIDEPPKSSIKLATPSIRKLARELGCDLDLISGSGKNNRITHEDVMSHVKRKVTNPNSTATNNDTKKKTDRIDEKSFLEYGAITKKSFNKIREITAKRMTESWTTIPHVTHFDEVKIDHLINLKREIESIEKSAKVSFLSFIIKALTKTLTEYKEFNSSPDIENKVLIIKDYINIGVAADTDKGLVVPVIHNANNLSLKKINDTIFNLSKKAKEGNLNIKEMSGGTFTVSSLGGIGGRFFTPIINKPEVAIMGISRTYKKTTLDKYGNYKEDSILPFSLSYDHRIIDGADTARFCNLFKKLLSDLKTFD
tara:strand:- start:238 stop:1533 length:1296 start_codon:yes stop_codon:yes gene_type:complete